MDIDFVTPAFRNMKTGLEENELDEVVSRFDKDGGGSIDRDEFRVCMRCIDEESKRGENRLKHLAFEDFLEALCRCAVCKSWPTRDEIDVITPSDGRCRPGNMYERMKSLCCSQ